MTVFNLCDDFDRADAGDLGNTSVSGQPYYIRFMSSWAIDTNQAACTAIGLSSLSVATPSAMVGAYQGVGVDIITPAGSDWICGVVLNASVSPNEGSMVYVNGLGDLQIATYTEGGITLTGGGTETVDVSAGSHTLEAVDDLNTITVWWDGSIVHTELSPATTGNNFGLIVADGVDSLDLRFDNLTMAPTPMAMPSVETPDLLGGVRNLFYESGVLFMPSVEAPALLGGLDAPPDPTVLTEIVLGSVPAPPTEGGGVAYIYSDTPNPPKYDPLDPWPVGYQYGPPVADLVVGGYPLRTAASCRPALNNPGEGSFTVPPPGPALGSVITYYSGGVAVFTGVADRVNTVIAESSEESGQLVSVQTPGILGVEWGDTVVWPDIAADQPYRLGPPPQDDREWGWPMNGLVTPGLSYIPSVAGDNSLYGSDQEVFPLPDNWPDVTSRVMWDRDPDQLHAPRGWCFFRVPFNAPAGDYALFMRAFDYAKLWIDGALLIECETAAATKRVDVSFDGDTHLAAIAAFNAGGKAGVEFTAMERTNEALLAPVMNSRSNWITLSYPKISLRATTGRILNRLVREAKARNAPAGDWTMAFTDEADSNGTPWPTGENTSLFFSQVGMTYWDVLMQMAEDRIDFRASPSGRTLFAYVKDTGGVARSVPWAHTVDAESIAAEVGGH